MSAGYVAISWNRHKRVYDACVGAFIALFLAVFVVSGKLAWTGEHAVSDEVLVLRALGSCSFTLLHIVLCIGPAARLWPRLLPLLYNRRHLGVVTFLLSLAHGVLAVGYYHGFGDRNPLSSLIETGLAVESLRTMPYQLFGAAGLAVLFVLAATSHDFWLTNLSPRAWKRIHMSVYGAYGLLVAHIAFGALQAEASAVPAIFTICGAAGLVALHLAAGMREVGADAKADPSVAGWIDAGDPAAIPDGRARVVQAAGGERIAVFRDGASISAVESRCAHQGGPLGEGKVIDGCITCPWHGWQYRAADGCSPPPFEERIRTYAVRISAGRLLVNPAALPPGTATEPARIDDPGERRDG
jgi:sulfoxide reductase heme-binding subunit YedZ